MTDYRVCFWFLDLHFFNWFSFDLLARPLLMIPVVVTWFEESEFVLALADS